MLFNNLRKPFVLFFFWFALCVDAHADEEKSSILTSKKKQPFEISQIGMSFESAFNNQNKEAVAELFNFPALNWRIAKSFTNDEKEMKEYQSIFSKKDRTDFIDRIFRSYYLNNVNATFTGITKDKRIVIRFDFPEGGLEFFLLKIEQGAATPENSIIDIYMATKGRDMSEIFGLVSQLIVAPNESLLNRVLGRQSVNRDLLKKIKKIGYLSTTGRSQEAYQKLLDLPANVKKERIILDLAVQLAQKVSMDEYDKQLAVLARYYGNDPSAAFMLIDYFIEQKQFNLAMTSIDNLASLIGEEAGLYTIRGNIMIEQGQPAKAINYANKSIQLEPDYEPAYWTKITAYLAAKDFNATTKALIEIGDAFGYEFSEDSFTGEDLYREYIQSKAFKNWML